MTVKKHSVEWTLKVGAEGGAEVSALKSELEKLGRIDSFAKLKKQTEDAEKEWRSATARVSAMARELSSAEKPTKKMAQEFDRAKTQAGRLKDQFEQQRLALHKLRGELGQAGINTTKLSSAQQQARARVAELQKTLNASNAEMGKTKASAGSAVTGLNLLRGGVGGVQSALAGLMRFAPGGIVGIVAGIAGGAAAGKAMEYAKIAAGYETIGVAMYVIGRNAGYTRKELDAADQSLRKSGISMQESRKNIAKLVAAKIDLSKATTLARIAQDAAIPAQLNSSEAFGHLVDGIQSAQVEMLRTLGINVSFEQSYRDMAKQIGKSATELTEAEKMQARLNIVIKAAAGIAGTYEESLETVGKKISSLTRLEDDAKTKIGSLFTPILAAGVDAYTWALKKLNEQMDKLITSSESGAKKSPLFSDGAAATGPTGAAIVGMFKFREYFTERMTLEKQAAEASNAIEDERAAKVKAINADLAEARSQNLESFLDKAKSTLKEAEAAEKQYAEQVKKYQEMADQARLSTQEKVRALLRTQMSDFDQYRDKQREAEESLAKAREALSGGDAAGGESWAKKAQEQFAQLNSEVKTGEQVLVSSAEANRIAVQGVIAAGEALTQSYLNRKKSSEEERLAEAERFQQAKADIETLEEAMSRLQDLEIAATVKDQATPVLDSIQTELGKIKDKTVTVTVRYRKVGDDGLADGGRVPGYAFGGRLPGYSLTDNMMGMIRGKQPIALAGGEDVTNALSSRVIYGAAPWLLPALNRVRTTADLSKVLAKLKNIQGLAGGGRVSESYRVTLAAGARETTMTTQSRSEYTGLKQFARALNKEKLVHGS